MEVSACDDLAAALGGLKAHNAREDDAGRRRKARLRAQRDGRRDVVALARGLVGVPMEEEEDEGGHGGANEPRLVAMQLDGASDEAAAKREAKGAYANALMSPEWMADVPDDIARAWLMMPRPAGQRCLVVSARGQTTARRRNGSVLAHFPSALPGGRRASAREQRGGARAFCVLDCIYDPESRVYHVLDIMVWRGHLLYDCHAAFRLFWTHSKLGEVEANVASRLNPCPFLPVPYYEASAATLRELYEATWPFPRDGLLFVHRETVYEPGPTPLVLLWTDARCSARFFDYGSTAMQKQLSRAPSAKPAGAWVHEMRDAALTYADLSRAVAASEAALREEMGTEAGLASVSRGPRDDGPGHGHRLPGRIKEP